MKKSFLFWLCFVFATILAVYFATRIIMTTMGHGRAATIKSISVSADMGKRNLSAIVAAAGIAPGTKTYAANLNDIMTRISNVPGVRGASVRRLPNGNLSIRVKLYHAVALWTDGTSFFPVSGDGTIINTPTDTRPENAVVFRGKLPDDIAEISKLGQNMAAHLDYFEWIENRRWNMHTNKNTTIMLPEENAPAALSALMLMDKKHRILSKNINVMDMRDPVRILVK